MIAELTAEQLHAIAVAAKPAAATRNQLVEGSKVKIDFKIHLTGELIINHGGECQQTSNAPAIDLIAALLAEFGPRKRKSIVEQIVADRMKKGYAVDAAAKEQAQRLLTNAATVSMVSRRGAVTGQISAALIK